MMGQDAFLPAKELHEISTFPPGMDARVDQASRLPRQRHHDWSRALSSGFIFLTPCVSLRFDSTRRADLAELTKTPIPPARPALGRLFSPACAPVCSHGCPFERLSVVAGSTA